MTQLDIMNCLRISYVANWWRMSGIDPRAFQGQILQIYIDRACLPFTSSGGELLKQDYF